MADDLIRASWLKYTMRCVRRQPGETPARVKLAAGDALLREIREAAPMAWLPGSRFVSLCTALRDALGTEATRDFWAVSLREAIDQPLIRPLAWGGLQLFGRTPAALYRRTPQAWALVTKNMGTMRAEPAAGDRSFVLSVEGLPTGCREITLLHMWEGGFVGQAAFVDARASVETDLSALAEGRATFRIRW